jgi:hypothetical protein
LLHRLIKDRDLLAQLPPGGKQRTHNQGDIGSALKQRFDPLIKSEPRPAPGSKPKVFSTPRIMFESRVVMPTS